MSMLVFPRVIAGLSSDEVGLYRLLVRRLRKKRVKNLTLSTYFEGKNALVDIGYALPPVAQNLHLVVGWPEKAVEELANRVVLDGVASADGSELPEGLARIVGRSNFVRMARSVHVDAMVHACSFVAVLAGDTSVGEPEVIIQEFTADVATGLWDRRRDGLVGALLFETDDEGESLRAGYLVTDSYTVTLERSGRSWSAGERTDHPGGVMPVEVFAYQGNSMRPFGRSRITPTVMSLTDSAVRTFLRSEIQADLYSVPPRYLLGVDKDAFQGPDGQLVPKWRVLMDQLLVFPADRRGNVPQVGQFSQYSFEPHIAQLRQTATMFAAMTSLPPDAMGVLTDNPSSADAIEKASKDLCLLAETCQRDWSPAWERVLSLVALGLGLDDVGLSVQWRNPRAPSRAAAADSTVKMVQAGILDPDSEVTMDMMDWTEEQRQTLRREKRAKRAQGLLASVGDEGESLADGEAREPVTV